MKILVIIQARMGSSRFPGKSFYKFNGIPALEHIVSSLKQVLKKSELYIATSDKDNNKPIVDFAESNDINVFQGDEENVASRFHYIIEKSGCDFFIRVNGDSPLYDYRSISHALSILKIHKYEPDLVSSFGKYPGGMNIEIVNSKTFLNAYPKFINPAHFEHVTIYFKENLEKFNVVFLEQPISNPAKYSFCFDTEEDRKKLEVLFGMMKKPHYEYTLKQKCDMYDLWNAQQISK